MTPTTYNSPTQRRNATAFSLIEVLLALGILAVGLTMAMAIFPVAVKENESSFNDVLGSLVTENALAICELALKGNAAVPASGMIDLTDDVNAFRTNSIYYPMPAATANISDSSVYDTLRGRIRVLADSDSMIVLAYRFNVDAAGNEIIPPDPQILTSANLDTADPSILKADASQTIANGTYVIHESGVYAVVIGKINNTTYQLDREMPVSSGTWWGVADAIGIRAYDVDLD